MSIMFDIGPAPNVAPKLPQVFDSMELLDTLGYFQGKVRVAIGVGSFAL